MNLTNNQNVFFGARIIVAIILFFLALKLDTIYLQILVGTYFIYLLVAFLQKLRGRNSVLKRPTSIDITLIVMFGLYSLLKLHNKEIWIGAFYFSLTLDLLMNRIFVKAS